MSYNERYRLPVPGLLALATAGFITILTEALPAGLLQQMSKDLRVSESLIGQLVTMYATGSLLAAIPLTTATQGWRRRPLLLIAISGFAAVNIITAVSASYALTLIARFFAGIFAGLLWAMLAGYAGLMVPEASKGRAIALAMVGTPLALSLGIPAGTLLGTLLGWRYTFGIMSFLTLLLIGWVLKKVPDFEGQASGNQLPIARVFAQPGIRAVLFVTFAFVLAHNLLYTYIAPFLVPSGLSNRVDTVLLVFGICSLLGIWIVGILIDRWLRELVLGSILLFTLASLALALGAGVPLIIYSGVAIWGLAFGGAATLFQTASAKTAGHTADIAQSMIVTVWNLAIAGGGIGGGVLLDTMGVKSIPWVLAIILIPSFLVAWQAKQYGFPAAKKTE